MRRRQPVALLLAFGLMAVGGTATAAAPGGRGRVPSVDEAGQAAYHDFLDAAGHRAFAIAPGGAWAWRSAGPSAGSVSEEALEGCESESGQRCLLYALDDRVVFDGSAWSRLWGPYLDRAAAARAPVGARRGERFHDLAFRTPSGHPMKLSDLRGSAVVLHFWGSWCPSCRREMSELQGVQEALGKSSGIKLILLQLREEIGGAREWARAQRLTLPLHDSGSDGEAEALTLADGRKIPDRAIATVFPTTYVLDRNGVVVFSHVGPIARWVDHLPLLRDVAQRSGR